MSAALSVEEVREVYAAAQTGVASRLQMHREDFDRWLESVRAEERERLAAEHMLRPRPWPPVPYPDDAAHQARWTIQRASDQALFKTGDHNEAYMAAADALLAEGWQPPATRAARIAREGA